MTYAVDLDKDGVKSDFFAVIKPRKRIQTFTLYSGAIYSTPVEENYVFEVYQEGIGDSLTPVDSIAAISAGEFFYDRINSLLYLRLPASGNPNSFYMTIAYGLFLGTDEAHLSYIPDTAASPIQYFEPRILASPIFKTSSSDILFGFLAVSGTSLSLNNADGYFWKNSFSSSFNYAEINIYHRLNDEFITKVFTGVCKNFRIGTKTFELEIQDKIDALEVTYEEKYFSEGDFPNLDKNFLNYPIRKIYGRVNNFQPINISYDEVASTTVNRSWVVSRHQNTKASISSLIVVAGANSTTQTELLDASGFVVGDSVVVTQGGAPTYSIYILTVDYNTNIVTHTAIPGRVIASGDLIRRGFIGLLTILDDSGSTWLVSPERDFTEVNFANDTKGFTLVNNFEASIPGFPSPFDPSKHQIYCTAYGEKDIPIFSGTATPVCAVTDKGGNLSDPLGIIYDLISDFSRQFRLNSIDVANWQSIVALNEFNIGFAIPSQVNGQFPTVKELVSSILKSSLLKMSTETSTKIIKTGPIGTPYKEIDASECGDFSFSTDYKDVYSDLEVHFWPGDLSASAFDLDPFFSFNSSVGQELHRENRIYKLDVYLWDFDEVDIYGDRVITYLGDRKMAADLVASTKFFGADLSKAVTLKLDALPGFELVPDTERQRNYQISETGKGYRGVSLVLEDQKGIEENLGVW